MKVIVHEAIMVETEAVALAIATEQSKEGVFVVIVGEDGLPVVATTEDVVGGFVG